jgi:hypothetical protein
MKALDETGSTGTCELISLKESFQTYINSKGGESKLHLEKAKKPWPYNIVEFLSPSADLRQKRCR